MKVLDTFCKAGGCSMGYAQAGFDVTGIDNEPQPKYPFEFIQGDAFDYLRDQEFTNQFDLIHASPKSYLDYADTVSIIESALKEWRGE